VPSTTRVNPTQSCVSSEPQIAERTVHIPSYRLPCVYLTSCGEAAKLASTLAATSWIRIHRAHTLDNAKAQLQNIKARVILADVTFDGGSWEDAVRMAERLTLRAALVLVSPFVDHRLWIDALEGGAYDLIHQPFHADELRIILTNAHMSAISGSYPFYGPRLEAADRADKQAGTASRKAAVSIELDHGGSITAPGSIDGYQLPSAQTHLSIDGSAHTTWNSRDSNSCRRFVLCPPCRNVSRYRIAAQDACAESVIRRIEVPVALSRSTRP
jgi:hypothetical protein